MLITFLDGISNRLIKGNIIKQTTLKINNFGLIRHLTALQIATKHTSNYLKIDPNIFLTVLYYIPGVPIFFFISGYFISKAYEKNPNIKEYAINRILRIYPALIVCTLFSLIIIHFTGYLANQEVDISEYIAWVLGEFSGILRAHPTFMEDYGAGTINGVFWVVTVQLQFYVLVPLIYWIFNLNNSKRSNIIILLLILFFMSLNVIFLTLYPDYKKTLMMQILKTSFLPWMYMFLIGIFFQKNFALFHRLLSGKGLYTLSLFFIVSYTGAEYFGWQTGNLINPIIYIFLVPTIFSLAYTKPKFGRIILRGKDISYGIYIYHMPIVNLAMYYGYYSKGYYVLAVLSISALIAMLSWILVEKPAMTHKKNPLKRIN